MSSDSARYPARLRATHRTGRTRSHAPALLGRLRAFPELPVLIAVAGVLNLWGLSINGWANTYYSAAVRSMSTSWHDFLFASLDRSGLMTVDKPPLSLWVQALSVRVFGDHPLSVLVPQALMGVAATALVYDLTRRRFGRAAGVAAGLALATTPVVVAVSRHNNPDELLLLCCVAAVWLALRALDTGRTRWLVWCGVATGLGFETKMGVALMVVPGIAAAYLWIAPSRQPPARHPASPDRAARESSGCQPPARHPASPDRAARESSGCQPPARHRSHARAQSPRAARESSGCQPPARHPASPDRAARESSGCRLIAIRQLLAGGAALAVVGLAWPVLVTLTPAADRPWISGTADNSIWSLIFSYNGVGRIAGQSGGGVGGTTFGGGGGGGTMFGGATGVLRLLQTGLGDQAGWLLGFAVVAGGGLLISSRLRRRDPRTGWLIAVGGAFLTTAVVFSFAQGIFHPYYVSFLAPFTAALVGAGVGTALRAEREARIIAALAIAAGAVTELVVLGTIGGQLAWARPVVILAALAGVLALVLRVSPRARAVGLAVATAMLLAAPATWAAETLSHPTAGTFPTGGPASAAGGFGGPPGVGARGRPFPGGGFGSVGPGAGAAPSGSSLGSLFGPGPVRGGGRGGGRTRGGGPGGFPGGGPGGFGGDSAALNAAIRYARAHGGGTIGVASQSTAAAAILDADANVAGLGGFSGRESSVTAAWIAMEVRDGRLRWVISDGTSGGQGFRAPGDTRQGSQAALAVVAKTCPAVALGSSSGDNSTMYDCQGRATAILAAARRA